MLIKGLLEEDFVNYKKTSMFIIFPFCDFKCDRENGTQLCQNWSLSEQTPQEVSVDTIINMYMSNPLSHAIVCGGLEPFNSYDDLLELLTQFRAVSDDDFVIFTGYNKDEIQNRINELAQFKNIVIKFGRFRPDQTPHLDPVLGIKLASDNQYAERIS